MKRLLLILFTCATLSCFAQFNATHFIDYEGLSDGVDPTTTTLNNSLHGNSLNTWGLQDATHHLKGATIGQKDLVGNITVYGVGTFGPGGSMGLKSELDVATDFMTPQPFAGGVTSMSIGGWFKTDIDVNTAANIDWFTVQGIAGGFVNAILFSPGDGSTLRISPELPGGMTPIPGTISITANTWYWITIGYNVANTNGNIIRVYDTTETLVGDLHRAGEAQASSPFRALIGCNNGTAAGKSIWMDNLMINTNGDFPLLPGSPCADMINSTNRMLWQLGVNAGVRGGIPHRSTIFTTLTSTATDTDINNAIASCPSNQVVKLGPGTYNNIAGALSIGQHNGVTLRGSGAGVNPAVDTILKPPALVGSQFLYIGVNSSESAGTAITSGWTVGSSNLTVASTTGLAVMDLVHIDEQADTNVMWSSDVTTDTAGTSRWINHMAQIMAINGSVVTIWPPLDWELTAVPKMHHYSGFKCMTSGVEDLCVDASAVNDGYGIIMEQTIDCWQSNVHFIKITGYVDYNVNSVFGELAKVYCDQQNSYGSSHGGILLGNVSGAASVNVTGFAVYNCISKFCQPGFQINGCNGSIIAYNLPYDTLNAGSDQAPGIDMNHARGAHMNLYEGNVSAMFDSDGNFGGCMKNTLYRNWAPGWTPSNGSLNSRPISLAHWDLFAQVVGNIIGHANIPTPNYFAPTNQLSDTSTVVYWLGFPNGSGNSSYTGTRPPSTERILTLDYNVTNTANFLANWDSFHKDIENVYCGALSNSLYLTTKPSWFTSTVTWPPVNPTNGLTGLDWNIIPAGVAYLNGGPGHWPDEVSPPTPSPATLFISGAKIGSMKSQ